MGEPLTRLRSQRFPGFQLGPDCNLNHTVAPFSEDLIGLVDLIEGEGARQERSQIQPSMRNQLHQPAHPFFAAWTECGDNFVISEAGRKWLNRQ
jgi:hypothetical protein